MKLPEPRRLASGNYFIQLRLGGESISITESSRAACIREARAIKAEYLAGKRAKAGGAHPNGGHRRLHRRAQQYPFSPDHPGIPHHPKIPLPDHHAPSAGSDR